jgi:hypothetical protein
MNATHTPGPWIASRKNNGLRPAHFQPPVVLARGGNLTVTDGLGEGPEAEANTKLIAAAPELLEVVEGIARTACLRQFMGNECICWSCKAKAAIAKATA